MIRVLVILIFFSYFVHSQEKGKIAIVNKVKCSNDTNICKNSVCFLKPKNRTVTHLNIGCNITRRLNVLTVFKNIFY